MIIMIIVLLHSSRGQAARAEWPSARATRAGRAQRSSAQARPAAPVARRPALGRTVLAPAEDRLRSARKATSPRAAAAAAAASIA